MDSIFINSFLAIENRDAWFDGAGRQFRGASSIWSPLQVSKETILRLVSGPAQAALKVEDFDFIFEMFRWRDQFLQKHGALRTPTVVYR